MYSGNQNEPSLFSLSNRDTKETIEDKIRRAEAKLGIPAGDGVAINNRRPSFDPGIIVILVLGGLLVRHHSSLSK